MGAYVSLSPLDQSRGHKLATKDDLLKWGVHLHHNACGGIVYRLGLGLSCVKCDLRWKPHVVAGFTDDAAATRFHVRETPDGETYVLVWMVDPYSKTEYTTLVPRAEAHKHKRFTV